MIWTSFLKWNSRENLERMSKTLHDDNPPPPLLWVRLVVVQRFVHEVPLRVLIGEGTRLGSVLEELWPHLADVWGSSGLHFGRPEGLCGSFLGALDLHVWSFGVPGGCLGAVLAARTVQEPISDPSGLSKWSQNSSKTGWKIVVKNACFCKRAFYWF